MKRKTTSELTSIPRINTVIKANAANTINVVCCNSDQVG